MHQVLNFLLLFRMMQVNISITEKNFTFDGRASIQVEALVASDRFILNAYNFKIQSYKVVDIDGTVVPINSICKELNVY